MANILTATEAANVLRCATNDPLMLDLLPSVDLYIGNATGHDWTADSPISPAAKSAARMLLVRWHEDPGAMTAGGALGFGLQAALTQLEALALELATAGIPDDALAMVASSPAAGAVDVAVSVTITVVFNHEMDQSAPAAVTLATSGGAAVACVNSLDATKMILTVNPSSSLEAATGYVVTITAAADCYGQTLTDTIGFTTASVHT